MPRITIEDKHTYNSLNTPIYGVHDDNLTFNLNNEANGRTIIKAIEPTYPVTGTDESNRIGRKIYTSSLVSEGFLKLYNTIDNSNVNTVYDVYTFHNSDEYTSLASQVTPQTAPFNTNEQVLEVSIRHMIVQFDIDELSTTELETYLWQWFTSIYIQTGTYNVTSNRTQMLRESTRFTGDYKILWEKVHHLTLRNPIIHYKEVIPYKKTMNFDGTGSGRPTNKLIMELFIGPTNIYTDYGSFSLGQWISNNKLMLAPNIYVAELSTTLKLKYTDM